MQGLLTLNNHICKSAITFSQNLTLSEKLKSDQFNSTLLKRFTKVEPVLTLAEPHFLYLDKKIST